jgi:uncharacterized Rmd1/YagE family protein
MYIILLIFNLSTFCLAFLPGFWKDSRVQSKFSINPSSLFAKEPPKSYAISLPHYLSDRKPRKQRPNRKGGQAQIQTLDEGVEASWKRQRVSVICLGQSIDIVALRKQLFEGRFDCLEEESKHTVETLLLSLCSLNTEIEDDEVISLTNAFPIADEESEQVEIGTQKPNTFVFSFGSVVFWGLSQEQESCIIKELELFVEEPVNRAELIEGFDELDFSYCLEGSGRDKKPIRFDLVKLQSTKIEEKLCFSYALAQSSKLFIYECRAFESLSDKRYLSRELFKNGKIQKSKKELNKLIGEMFELSTGVNLFSSILDRPDFLWDNDEYGPLYEYCRRYLDVEQRVELLNSRLSVMRDMFDVLTAQVADSNSERLEWIIIWLISIEIVLGILQNPLFAGRRVVSAMLVPSCIFLFKKINLRFLL